MARQVEQWRDYNRTWLDSFLGGEATEEYKTASTHHYSYGFARDTALNLSFLIGEIESEISKLEFLDQYALGYNRAARLAELIPASQAQQDDIDHDHAQALTRKLRQADTALTGIEADLQAIEDAAPLPGSDLTLIDELPYAPGLLAHAPDDLRERLAAAFAMQAIYRQDTRQATIVLTITDTTPPSSPHSSPTPASTTTPPPPPKRKPTTPPPARTRP